jgi:hypothetical protein
LPILLKLASLIEKAYIIAIKDSQASSQVLLIPNNNKVDENKNIFKEKKR